MGLSAGWAILGHTGNRKGLSGMEGSATLSNYVTITRRRAIGHHLGRWIHRDPVKSYAPNLYTYSASNPLPYLGSMSLTARGQQDGPEIPGGGKGPRPGEPDECKELEEKYGPGYLGGTGCVNGQAIYCVFLPPPTGPGASASGYGIVAACLAAHEQSHANGADCSESEGPTPELPANAPTPSGEWKALDAELDCYSESNCNGDTRCANYVHGYKEQACAEQLLLGLYLGGLRGKVSYFGLNLACLGL
jgi:hypothetical protein